MSSSAKPADRTAASGIFTMESDTVYQSWRERKLSGYPKTAEELRVNVGDPRALTPTETEAIRGLCRKTNMAIYRSALGRLADKAIPRQLGEQFDLTRLDANMLADEDAISSVTVVPGKGGRGYIPYTNHRLQWHTDGYYNPPIHRVRAFILHCIQPAARGGENSLLDPEIVYIHLRDANPSYIEALMAEDAMTIPANTESGVQTRAASIGPVFSVDPATGSLHMRYTARTRSIVWKDDMATRAAVKALDEVLAGDSAYLFRYRLAEGEGLICNNVLHSRTAFEDDAANGITRLLYRARYYDRIEGTGLDELGA